MSAGLAAAVVFVIVLAVLVALAMLGYRQSKRARAATDDDVEGANFLSGVAFLFAFLASPLGILFAHLSLRQIAQTGAPGARLATAALWIAYGLTVVQLALLLWNSFTGYLN